MIIVWFLVLITFHHMRVVAGPFVAPEDCYAQLVHMPRLHAARYACVQSLTVTK